MDLASLPDWRRVGGLIMAKRPGLPIINQTVIDGGKTYRVASMGTRVLIVARKLKDGKNEIALDPEGATARRIIGKSREPQS